ncbi:hypothetical protein L5515_006583 [Caenorhabditis briggsae]|uniref:Cilia- and flagella-associated protein 157 n=1 Tax=Caenorhabditis briggsae TaxID=6238 RepID=A0AAE9F2Y6_CAEBR|nr:hypothetical protein L5515_006583 [Caenorhabditis briggsae]
MNETNRSTAGSNSIDSSEIGDPAVERLAPVSVKSSQKIHRVFHELIDSWKKYTDMDDGDRISLLLQNYTVEKQLEQVGAMEKEEILEVLRVNLRKMTTIQEENELLTRKNREVSEKLHRIEHRVGKAQVNVFDRVQTVTMDILKEFHERELELARKLEILEAQKADFTARNEKLEAKIRIFEKNVDSLQAKNGRLAELNDENEQKIAQFSRKIEVQDDEIFHLREQLVKANELAREKTEEALHEAVEAQRVKTLILKERETANTEAARQKEMLMRDMDNYKADLEKDLTIRHQRHKKEVEALNAKFDSAMAHSEQTIQELKTKNHQLEAEISKYKRNFAIMEAQIKGDVKRSLAVNYHEMMNIVSSGTCRLPSPPRENPFLLLDSENRRPVSPKRTLGVQTSSTSSVKGGATSSRDAKKTTTSTKFSSSVNSGTGGLGSSGRGRSASCSRK